MIDPKLRATIMGCNEWMMLSFFAAVDDRVNRISLEHRLDCLSVMFRLYPKGSIGTNEYKMPQMAIDSAAIQVASPDRIGQNKDNRFGMHRKFCNHC